ncbi:MAG TPA: antitoxin Xre-like helix-turn-helix domain-containing protein [Candidatus Kapabacteria bacterium]|jgi:putative toxin-antitoxin system antitoxin component (TIGR02293 family)|nr:antitoxin Xre-like helix-turn-helix domain-containing protein [Candidatus Kapabacteria bacterium]
MVRDSQGPSRAGRIAALDPLHLIDASRAGVKPQLAEQIQKESPFSQQEWSEILGLTPRTLQRYQREHRSLDVSASERILLVAKILEQGRVLFRDAEAFERWLRRPSIPLGGKEPRAILDTVSGIQLVSDELTRIGYGVLA